MLWMQWPTYKMHVRVDHVIVQSLITYRAIVARNTLVFPQRPAPLERARYNIDATVADALKCEKSKVSSCATDASCATNVREQSLFNIFQAHIVLTCTNCFGRTYIETQEYWKCRRTKRACLLCSIEVSLYRMCSPFVAARSTDRPWLPLVGFRRNGHSGINNADYCTPVT